ncbi:MAG: hypothetical protein WC343_10140, partial [Bacilli bacterium]
IQLTIMDAKVCPEKTTINIPPYHRAIVNDAMRSGRYGNFSEFFRECIDENGRRRGFAPAADTLSPRARGSDISTRQTDNHTCPQGENECLQA